MYHGFSSSYNDHAISSLYYDVAEENCRYTQGASRYWHFNTTAIFTLPNGRHRFRCNICNWSQVSTKPYKFNKHIYENMHKNSLDFLTEGNNDTETVFWKVVDLIEGGWFGNYFRVLDNNFYRCFSCGVSVQSQDKLIDHLFEDQHQDRLGKRKILAKLMRHSLLSDEEKYDYMMKQIEEQDGHLFYKYNYTPCYNPFSCLCCDIRVTSYFNLLEHVMGSRHKRNLQ